MKQPLFATLLETQTDLEQVSAGNLTVTNNLQDQLITGPSSDGMAVTMAYPSDSDGLDPRAGLIN